MHVRSDGGTHWVFWEVGIHSPEFDHEREPARVAYRPLVGEDLKAPSAWTAVRVGRYWSSSVISSISLEPDKTMSGWGT